MKLTIVIPAHNEEDIILTTLSRLSKKIRIPHRIIVVNDHSTDRTSSIVKEFSKLNRHVTLINNLKSRRGFSSALKTGFRKANSDYVIPVMADLCDDPNTINKMYAKIDEGWDIVCGSRYMRGGRKKGGPMIQGFFSALVCRTIKILTGIQTHDVSNAFKLYNKAFLKRVTIRDGAGVEISMEITLRAFLKGAKITEIPTFWRGRTVGQSKFKILQRSPEYAKIFFWSVKNSLFRSLSNTLEHGRRRRH